jgi:thiosulfate dehydrogenase [quinone] large subunit
MSCSCSNRSLAYVVFRIVLGTTFLFHGVARMLGGGIEAFASGTTKIFTGTPLPAGLVHAFLSGLPYVEGILGVLILLGLFTRWALAIGSLLIAVLIFGTSMRSDWVTVSIQMIYAIALYLALANLDDNCCSLDKLLSKSSASSKA